MTKHKIPAVFIRSGTRKGVFFKEEDLPASRAQRDALFLRVLGSPDPYQRQLDGMGGGLSSVSKVVVIGRSNRPDADIDYTFVQIAVDKPVADYAQACGNLSAAVGPYAVEEGIIPVGNGDMTVRVYNTNTDKIYHAHFQVRDGHGVGTGTGGMCLAAACQVSGSIPHRLARRLGPGQDIRIGTPSGVVTIAAQAQQADDGRWRVERVTVCRTQRRLMEGFVVLPRD